MCRTWKSTAVLCVTSFILPVPTMAENNIQGDMLHQIVALRLELSEYLLENHVKTENGLVRELDEIRRQQKDLQQEVRAHNEHVAQLDRQLAGTDTALEVRTQIEAARAQLGNQNAEALRSRQVALANRETEVTQELERETQRGRSLAQRTQQLRTALIQK